MQGHSGPPQMLLAHHHQTTNTCIATRTQQQLAFDLRPLSLQNTS